MFLATTSLPAFCDKQAEILFLGPWCGGPRARTLPSPWDDRERFHAAAEYLDRRMEEILPPLADCLNAQLGHSGNPRGWRILAGTWLIHSLHVMYDRYIHLRDAFEKHPALRTLLLDPASFRTPTDTRQAAHWMLTDDTYNLQIFSQLLAGMGYSFPARALPKEPPAGNRSPIASAKQALRGGSQWIESALARLLGGRSETALVEMHCPRSVLWALCRKTGFKAIPFALPERMPERPAHPPLRERFRSGLAGLPAADEFMRLWVRSLPENFPTLYLEGFGAAREQALRRLRHVPRTLVSATGWHYSEPFKFFAAEVSERGGRLVAVQHGGGYGLRRSMPMELHERRISDLFLGWEEAPSLQLAAAAKGNRATAFWPAARKDQVLFVTATNPRYPFRFYSAPQAHQLEEYFEWQTRFLEKLGGPLRSRTVIRLHPKDYGHRRRQRLEERFRDLRWDRRRGFIGSASRSRLLVVDHPSTSMLSALAGNFPTLLFWDPRLWEFRADAAPLLESLREAGLFYENPQAAATAVGKILLEGPERWWNRRPVQAARHRFAERYAPTPAGRLQIWSEILMNSARRGKSVLAAARCAGAANALLPVFQKLLSRPQVQLRVIAEAQALQIFRERGIPVEEAPAGPQERESFLYSLFRDGTPDALLLGTSWGASIEKELLRIGRERGIPALSVVDHWAHYRERFLEPGSKTLRLPDRIALMDAQALEQAVADGLPREILKVTGHPHLQSLAAALSDPSLLRQADELRSGWLRGARGPLLLFCSETFSDDLGYTETDALEGLAEALDLFEEQHSVRPTLVVKLHPKQPADRFHAGPRASRRGFGLAQAEPAWACLLAADFLVGMTSMILVEAAVAGRPAISYQPAKGIAAPFIGTETGLVRFARSPESIATHLSDCLSSCAAARGGVSPNAGLGAGVSVSGSDFLRRLLSGDAAGRIADLLCDLRAKGVG